MNKYRNVKITVDGIKFDSMAEASRYSELVMMQKAGLIRNLERQVRIELLPRVRLEGTTWQRAIVYIADFTYEEKRLGGWRFIIEDKKGHKTKDYILKKKMLLYKIAKGKIVGKFIET